MGSILDARRSDRLVVTTPVRPRVNTWVGGGTDSRERVALPCGCLPMVPVGPVAALPKMHWERIFLRKEPLTLTSQHAYSSASTFETGGEHSNKYVTTPKRWSILRAPDETTVLNRQTKNRNRFFFCEGLRGYHPRQSINTRSRLQ